VKVTMIEVQLQLNEHAQLDALMWVYIERLIKKYVRPCNIWMEMYAAHIMRCPRVSNVEYALCVLLRLEKKTDGIPLH